MSNIRNFSIIAHIDHGKSTLADRLIEYLNAIPKKDMKEQFMDSLELERERGITIRSKTIKMYYKSVDGATYILNLIDTPGHVDFSLEVYRALIASDGVILVVDASQGVEAQTVSHTNLARKLNLKIIPVINKIDLSTADVGETKRQIKSILEIDDEPILVSAKLGIGVKDVLDAIIEKISPPRIYDVDFPIGVVFDLSYDHFRGVVAFVKMFGGELKMGDKISFQSSNTTYEVEEVGYMTIDFVKNEKIIAGDVGYVICGVRDIHSIKIGDIFYLSGMKPAVESKFQESKPFVFADVYPLNQADFPALKSAIEKLHLVDFSFLYSQTYSEAFGAGFHCGFLGLLHLEIFKERISREYNLDVIVTSPNIMYEIVLKDGTVRYINNPAKFPATSDIKEIREMYVKSLIVTPIEYLNPVIELCKNYRAENITLNQTDPKKVIISLELPLAEIIINFYSELKSVSKGYASFDYEIIGYRKSDIVKLSVLVKFKEVEALSVVVHRSKAYEQAQRVAQKLKQLIPRHLFEIPIQVKMDNRIIVREDIKALRKDVTAKLYGGDRTRKIKLLEKQKEGKKKLKMIGNVEIPAETFFELLKL